MKKQLLWSWGFVTVQAILFALIMFVGEQDIKPPAVVAITGGFLLAIGAVVLGISVYNLRKSLTALPLPVKGGSLQSDGLYRYMRHPMYSGILGLTFGYAMVSGSSLKYLFAFTLLGLFIFKALYEEKLLAKKYKNYIKYKQKTPMFFPFTKF